TCSSGAASSRATKAPSRVACCSRSISSPRSSGPGRSHGATDLLTTPRPRSDYCSAVTALSNFVLDPASHSGESSVKHHQGGQVAIRKWCVVASLSLFAVVALPVPSIGSAKPEATDPIKVAVVTDIGGLNDKGFN